MDIEFHTLWVKTSLLTVGSSLARKFLARKFLARIPTLESRILVDVESLEDGVQLCDKKLFKVFNYASGRKYFLGTARARKYSSPRE